MVISRSITDKVNGKDPSLPCRTYMISMHSCSLVPIISRMQADDPDTRQGDFGMSQEAKKRLQLMQIVDSMTHELIELWVLQHEGLCS